MGIAASPPKNRAVAEDNIEPFCPKGNKNRSKDMVKGTGSKGGRWNECLEQ